MKPEKLTKEALLNQIKVDLQKKWLKDNKEHLSIQRRYLFNQFSSLWRRWVAVYLFIILVVTCKFFQVSDAWKILIILALLALFLLFRRLLERKYVDKRLLNLDPIDIESATQKYISEEIKSLPKQIENVGCDIEEMEERLKFLQEIQKETFS